MEEVLAKSLKDMLKEKGLDLAEDAAKLLVDAVLDFAEQAVRDSENKLDDILLAIIPLLRPMLMEYIDKIDGKKG